MDRLLTFTAASPLATAAAALAAVCLVYLIAARARLGALAALPGPRNVSLFWGNQKEMLAGETGVELGRLQETYGTTFRYAGLFSRPRVCTADPEAINRILKDGYGFPKPRRLDLALRDLMGAGLVSANDDAHRRVRRIYGPCFTTASIRGLVPKFLDVAERLSDAMADRLGAAPGAPLDMPDWVGRAGLDVIGSGGFGYDFQAVAREDNALASAVHHMFKHFAHMSLLDMLALNFPVFRLIPSTRARRLAEGRRAMVDIGMRLIAEREARAMEEARLRADDKVVVADLESKDILTKMVAHNVASDLPASQRLTSQELVDNIMTLIVAGYETASTTIAWGLYALANDARVQAALHADIATLADVDTPTDAQLDALDYLDAFVREALRVFPAVPATIKQAKHDTVLPLRFPVKHRATGEMMHEVVIPKGSTVELAMLHYNTHRGVWGDDAAEFKPERWLGGALGKGRDGYVDGPLSHVSTFLGGPRGCIGWRFAVLEIKAILFVLVRDFAFAHADPRPRYVKRTNLVMRSEIDGRPDAGRLLLRVTPRPARATRGRYVPVV